MEGKSFLDRAGYSNNTVLELIRGQNKQGMDIYALLLLSAGKVPELRKALAGRDVVLEDFGTVLATGDGHEPSPEVLEAAHAALKASAVKPI